MANLSADFTREGEHTPGNVHNAFDRALDDFKRQVDDYSPFFDERLMEHLEKAIRIVEAERVGLSLGKPDDTTRSQWHAQRRRHLGEFRAAARDVSTHIQNRLAELRVVE